MSNALLLKKAMKTLDLSGAELARRLSRYRSDGRDTAPETVSRWLSGASNVDPAVLAWLEEMLRSKALKSPAPMVDWPEGKKTLKIGVTSPKGGVGTTTLAMNLAVVANIDFRVEAHHISLTEEPSAVHIRDMLKRIGVPACILSASDTARLEPDDKEMMIVDIPSHFAFDAINDNTESFLSALDLDILLVPVDCGSRIDITHISKLLDVEGMKSKIRIAHRPKHMVMDFSQTCALEGLDVTADYFYPYFMPQAYDASLHIPADLFEDWRNIEQQRHHQTLFEYIIQNFGGDVSYSPEVMNAIERMSLLELVEYFGN